MTDTADDPAGLMILRLWSESGDRMRIRITRTGDVTSGQFTTSYAASSAEVVRAVESWIESMVTPR